MGQARILSTQKEIWKFPSRVARQWRTFLSSVSLILGSGEEELSPVVTMWPGNEARGELDATKLWSPQTTHSKAQVCLHTNCHNIVMVSLAILVQGGSMCVGIKLCTGLSCLYSNSGGGDGHNSVCFTLLVLILFFLTD